MIHLYKFFTSDSIRSPSKPGLSPVWHLRRSGPSLSHGSSIGFRNVLDLALLSVLCQLPSQPGFLRRVSNLHEDATYRPLCES